ncbi:hypothetical protein BS78_02G387600 [Paspalum vaginatum]|nr:hypothetical protein BS78_02G387600 [Paspalum vaginatum]
MLLPCFTTLILVHCTVYTTHCFVYLSTHENMVLRLQSYCTDHSTGVGLSEFSMSSDPCTEQSRQ